MGAALSLIPELEQMLRHGSCSKRAETLRRVTALFLDGAERYNDAHIELFDDVFGLLIEEIESRARAELARCLAPVDRAPINIIRKLANDDDIVVAGPVLEFAPRLAEHDLVDLAETKGQAHLQAISARPALGEAVTDVLVRRGDGEVARRLVENRGARISETGFSRLVERAEDDDLLAEKIGLRPDIPPQLFGDLLARATAVVHRRLLASARPELKAELGRILQKVSAEVAARIGPRDYRAAQRVVLGMHRAGFLNEAALAAFAAEGKYQETIVALAALSTVPINVAERLMAGERPDTVLILCKAAGIGWPTVKSVIMLRTDGKVPSPQVIDSALADYGRLSASTAQRVVRFWRLRKNTQRS